MPPTPPGSTPTPGSTPAPTQTPAFRFKVGAPVAIQGADLTGEVVERYAYADRKRGYRVRCSDGQLRRYPEPQLTPGTTPARAAKPD